MKALSIRLPYSMLIADKAKTIEWRSWNTTHRGDILIHSSSYMPSELKGIGINSLALCIAELVDVVPFGYNHLESACMDFMPEPAGYAFILENIRIIEPFYLKGKTKLFDVSDELIHVVYLDYSDPECVGEYWQSLGLIEL